MENQLENMWERDYRNPFSFSKVREYFEPYTIQQIIQAFTNQENLNENIKFFYDNEEHMSGFLLPGGEAVSFWLEDAEKLPFQDRNVLEFITYPVYAVDGNVQWADVNETLWETRWEENYDRLDTVAIGGRTDFYDRFGWWPFAVAKDIDFSLPLMYHAELKIENRKAYMFSELNYMDEKLNGVNDSALFPHYGGFREVIIFEDTLTLPDNFRKELLTAEQETLYTPTVFDVEHGEKRLIPHDPLFNFIAGVNSGSIPDAPFNNFLFQLPVPWHGFQETEPGLFTVDSGDYGSTRVFWDKQDNFSFDYQQT